MDFSTLSKQLNIPVNQLRSKISEAGFFVSPRANKIDNLLAKQIIQAFSERKQAQAPKVAPKDISLPKVLSVKELAERLNLDVTIVIKKLIQNGVLASINEEIDYDTAAIIASDLGFNVAEKQEASSRLGLGYVSEAMKAEFEVDKDKFIQRPPVVAVMGHVDHGKTTLLDTIRKTKVVDSEAGSITQHIGAYQVLRKDKFITFLDTPGHEAFSTMRARGANVTDIIVLVVAADDGVKPQTIEVINRAKLTGTPLIVALNKVDKSDANLERVKKELGDYGVLIEEWGGMVPVAKISALTSEGVDELLDLILLQAEVLGLKANPQGQTLGTVIESHLSRTQGPVATVIIQNGTLNLTDIVSVGIAFGKVRTMSDALGKKIKQGLPSLPVLITGLSNVAAVGDILKTYASLEEARNMAMNLVKSDRAKKISTGQITALGKELNLILKVDVQGSLDAITEGLAKLKNDEIKINILDQAAGEISENDVNRAEAGRAIILGFHTRLSAQAAKLAQSKKVPVKLYDIIYELLEDLTHQVVEMLTPEVIRTDLGRLKILAVFRTEKDRMVIGGSVAEGKITDKAQFEIKRPPRLDGESRPGGDEIVGSGQVLELQQNKVKVPEVHKGTEFGLSVKSSINVEVDDVLVVFEETVRKKTL